MIKFTKKILAVSLTLATVAGGASAQTAKDEIAKGDKATLNRNGVEALTAYEKAIRLDTSNIDAAYKIVSTAVALSEFGIKEIPQAELVSVANKYASIAKKHRPNDVETHYLTGQALGRAALVGGQMAKLKNSPMIYTEASTCLAEQPKHAGCAHIMANWHAEVMRLSKFESSMAKKLMDKAYLIDSASWENAIKYMQQAIKNDPDRSVHYFSLGRIYFDKGDKVKAKETFAKIQGQKLRDFNDEEYKKRAKEYIEKIGK